VYDMYPWDKDASPGGSAPPNPPDLGGTFPSGPPAPRRGNWPGPLANALQFALDRRDNGGDTLSAAGQAPARPARQ
jgi:hypothetical protein